MTVTKPNKPDTFTIMAVMLSFFAALGAFLIPIGTLSRSFGGEGAILVHPGRVFDFTGFLPASLPDFSFVMILTWVTLAALVALAALAWVRSKGVLIAGVVVIVLAVAVVAAFVRAIDLVQFPLLETGTAYRRLPFQKFGLHLWPLLVFVAGAAGVLAGLAQNPTRAHFFMRQRALIVPVMALLFALVVGGVVILVLQPVPGGDKVPGIAGAWFGAVDLLWFAYSTLFGPAFPRFRPSFDLALPLFSLAQSTPLIFTGLALSFGFRTGLFNIGAPGQIIFGAMATTLVGLYVPGPWFVVAPIAVFAAAFGGALWGALPGWLKARFGASEVINTIMLNVIASSIMIFVLSESSKFFGRQIRLPFKAEGGESKSLELLPGSHLPKLVDLLGLHTGNNSINFAPWLALVGLLIGLSVWRGVLKKRFVAAFGLAVLGFVIGLVFFQNVNVPISSSMMSTRLNVSFLIALVAAWLVGVVLWRTTLGYELRAVGLSPKAAEYGGVNIARNTILAMAISGALAGLAATHFVLGAALDEYRLKAVIPAEQAGFGGITTALLGNNTPNGVLGASVFFGVLSVGGLQLSQSLNKVSREVVTVLQAFIILFIATRAFLSADFFRITHSELEIKPPQDPSDLESSNDIKSVGSV